MVAGNFFPRHVKSEKEERLQFLQRTLPRQLCLPYTARTTQGQPNSRGRHATCLLFNNPLVGTAYSHSIARDFPEDFRDTSG